MECLARAACSRRPTLGVDDAARLRRRRASASSTDSAHNAELGVELLDAIVAQRGSRPGAGRRGGGRGAWPGRRARQVLDPFVYIAFARKGWMVPNQYWTPGALAPMPIMGKYYMYYGPDFLPPRELGRHERRAHGAGADPGQPRASAASTAAGPRRWAARSSEALYGRARTFVGKVTDDGEPDQQPQLLGLLGVGAERRPRARVPEAAPRRRRRRTPRARTSGSAASRRTAARPRSTSGTRCTRARTSRCWSSREWRMRN